jgi:hypothetical protein
MVVSLDIAVLLIEEKIKLRNIAMLFSTIVQ